MLAVLADHIVGGKFAPASVLSPVVLGESFGVSRAVIREALISLEERGLVRAKQGMGTTVTSPDQWNLLDPILLDAAIRNDETLGILEDLVAVRVTLECEMTRKAAVSMDQAAIEELGRALRVFDRLQGEPEDFYAADAVYHDVIHRHSGNNVARSVIRLAQPHARASSRYNAAPAPADISRSQVGYVAIYEHLTRHGPNAFGRRDV